MFVVGSKVPASQVNDSIVEKFRADNLKEAERVMVPYTSLCQKKQVYLFDSSYESMLLLLFFDLIT